MLLWRDIHLAHRHTGSHPPPIHLGGRRQNVPDLLTGLQFRATTDRLCKFKKCPTEQGGQLARHPPHRLLKILESLEYDRALNSTSHYEVVPKLSLQIIRRRTKTRRIIAEPARAVLQSPHKN